MPYLSFFKLQFGVGLQYRFSAVAGLATQFFWGMMMIFLYESFYKNGINTPLNWTELVSYVWLGQAFYAVVFFRWFDRDISETIRTGQVSYEFVRPLNIYWMWFAKICAKRLSACALRFLPVVVVAALLPSTYALHGPISFANFILFLIALILGLMITTASAMLIYTLMFYTTSCKGLFNIYGNFADFLSGMDLPISFMPKALQVICFILPFRLSMDFPIRTYVGDIGTKDAIIGVLTQIIWIIILSTFGNFLMKKVDKKLVVQGG